MKVLQKANKNTLNTLFILIFLSSILIFTGCSDKNNPVIGGEENTTPDSIPEPPELLNPNLAKEAGQIVLLPKGYENEPNINEKMTNLSEGELNSYAENYRVSNYLESINKAEDILETLDHGQLYTDTDMSKHLTEKQMEDLQLYKAELSDREPWYWGYISCWAGGSFKLYRQYYFNPPAHWGAHYWYSQYGC